MRRVITSAEYHRFSGLAEFHTMSGAARQYVRIFSGYLLISSMLAGCQSDSTTRFIPSAFKPEAVLTTPESGPDSNPPGTESLRFLSQQQYREFSSPQEPARTNSVTQAGTDPNDIELNTAEFQLISDEVFQNVEPLIPFDVPWPDEKDAINQLPADLELPFVPAAVDNNQNPRKVRKPAPQPELAPDPFQYPAPAIPRQNGPAYFDVEMIPPVASSQLQIEQTGENISIIAREAPLSAVVTMLAQQHGLNVILSEDLEMGITLSLQDVPLQDALDTILATTGCTWVLQKNIILITKISKDSNVRPYIQGRQMRVIPLNFVSASEVEKVVTGLLSPLGQIFIHETDPLDKRRTQERIIIEDLPEYVSRVENYVLNIDRPPRQVLIEAHVMQIKLDDECRHGVNLSYISQLAGADISVSSGGFANSMASPAFLLDISGGKIDNIVEAIQDTNDAKTLASPKVLILNGQEAKIQIGEQIGYKTTTVTQTSTVENVDFLDVGVVLNVTPIISDDGRILMKVKPEVSTGFVNPTTGLPDKETTEVDTTVMVQDGHGVVIGGLIKEIDTDRQSKIPIIGNLKYIGYAFQRRTKVKERNEIIITLIPRIVPYQGDYRCIDQDQLNRSMTPLLYGPLLEVPRGEPELLNSRTNPAKLRTRQPCQGDALQYPQPYNY